MPKHFVSLCSLPTTELLQSYCIAEYHEELTNANIVITNPAKDRYVLSASHTYKRSLVWNLEMVFKVYEFDEPLLMLTEIIITDSNHPLLHLEIQYNMDPRSLQYEWGQFTSVREAVVKDDSYYLLAMAALKDGWAHAQVYAKATRRVIQAHHKHHNTRPTSTTDPAAILDALQEKMDLRIGRSTK